jgi:acetylglutamate kinase
LKQKRSNVKRGKRLVFVHGGSKESVQSIENGKRKIIRDYYTGKIENVNSGLLTMLPDKGYMPVRAAVNEELPRRVHAHSAFTAESTAGSVSRVINADG